MKDVWGGQRSLGASSTHSILKKELIQKPHFKTEEAGTQAGHGTGPHRCLSQVGTQVWLSLELCYCPTSATSTPGQLPLASCFELSSRPDLISLAQGQRQKVVGCSLQIACMLFIQSHTIYFLNCLLCASYCHGWALLERSRQTQLLLVWSSYSSGGGETMNKKMSVISLLTHLALPSAV